MILSSSGWPSRAQDRLFILWGLCAVAVNGNGRVAHSAIMRRAAQRLNPRHDLRRMASARLQRLLPVQYGLHSVNVVRFRSFGYRFRQP